MGILVSKVFTDADPATVAKLENCALGTPSEVQSHFTIGASGEHIRRVQEALKAVQEREPALGIPPFSVNGIYDSRFAEAIRVYKLKRDIRNYGNAIDNIVGVKTILTLDRESKSVPKTQPPSPVRPVGPPLVLPHLTGCIPASDCPPAQNFQVALVMGVGFGDGLVGGAWTFSIFDTSNRLRADYTLLGGGAGLGAPLSVSFFGRPKPFGTSRPVRVTRFGPKAAFGGASDIKQTSVAGLSLWCVPEGAEISDAIMLPPISIDTGPQLSNFDGSVNTGAFVLTSFCNGALGAIRKPIPDPRKPPNERSGG